MIPILTLLTAMFMYRYNGKREMLHLDLVQFMYGFVVFPLFFVWAKSFLFFLLQRWLEIEVSVTQMFLIDTFLSLVMLYLFAFIVIHSLTKTFSLKLERDPLYDLFEHSEYFHGWLTHAVLFGGIMLLMTVVAHINVFVPLQVEMSRWQFLLILLVAVGVGLVKFLIAWSTDLKEREFLRFVKLLLGLSLVVHMGSYFLFEPPFSIEYGAYWFAFVVFVTATTCSFLFHRSERAVRWANKLKPAKKKQGSQG